MVILGFFGKSSLCEEGLRKQEAFSRFKGAYILKLIMLIIVKLSS